MNKYGVSDLTKFFLIVFSLNVVFHLDVMMYKYEKISKNIQPISL